MSTSHLYRQQALDHKRDTWLGDILLARPTSFAALTCLFVGIALATLCYLAWGEYTKKARATGYLVPDQGLIKIYAQQAGAIADLRVREGQTVSKGDVLAVVSTERTSLQGSTQAEIAKHLLTKQQSLQEEKSKTTQLYAQQMASAQTRLLQLRQEQNQLHLAAQAQQQRVANAEKVVARHSQLYAEKFISELLLEEKKSEVLDQQNRLRELERTKIASERDTVGLQTDLQNMPLRLRNEIAALERNLAELANIGLENEARRESYVLAPQDGVVTALQIDRGKQANPALAMMSLIPTGGHLQADLYIPSRAVGFVRVGNFAQLQYQAFPYQKFGSYAGKVIKISRTSVPAQELPFPVSGASSDAYYIVTISPEHGHVLAYGKTVSLQTGMQVDADIWLDRRTLLEWILEPIYSVSGRV